MARVKAKRKSAGKKSPPAAGGRLKQLLLPRARVLVALVVIGLLGWGMHSLWDTQLSRNPRHAANSTGFPAQGGH